MEVKVTAEQVGDIFKTYLIGSIIKTGDKVIILDCSNQKHVGKYAIVGHVYSDGETYSLLRFRGTFKKSQILKVVK